METRAARLKRRDHGSGPSNERAGANEKSPYKLERNTNTGGRVGCVDPAPEATNWSGFVLLLLSSARHSKGAKREHSARSAHFFALNRSSFMSRNPHEWLLQLETQFPSRRGIGTPANGGVTLLPLAAPVGDQNAGHLELDAFAFGRLLVRGLHFSPGEGEAIWARAVDWGDLGARHGPQMRCCGLEGARGNTKAHVTNARASKWNYQL